MPKSWLSVHQSQTEIGRQLWRRKKGRLYCFARRQSRSTIGYRRGYSVRQQYVIRIKAVTVLYLLLVSFKRVGRGVANKMRVCTGSQQVNLLIWRSLSVPFNLCLRWFPLLFLLLFGTQRRSWETRVLPTRRGEQKGLHAQEPPGPCSVSD